MGLLELINDIERKSVSSKEVKLITSEQFAEFRRLLAISPEFEKALSLTDDNKEYFKAFELLNSLTPNEWKEDLFYAAKLGFFFEGVPSKLVFLLRKAIKKQPGPNSAISSIDPKLLQRYFKDNVLPNGVSVKEVMVNILGREFDLLSSFRRKCYYKDIVEIYVENTNRVLVGPKELGDLIISLDDLKSISFVEGLGVCVGDTPLRILNGKIGVCFDEYDLRDSI